LEDFLDSVKSEASVLNFPPHHSSRLLNGFAYSTLLLLGRTRPAVRSSYPPASPHRSNDNEVVQKYQSVIHRLRLSASAYVQTSPEQTSLPQESLGFQCKTFSLFFRYSYRHSHFYTLHKSSRS